MGKGYGNGRDYVFLLRGDCTEELDDQERWGIYAGNLLSGGGVRLCAAH